MKKSTKVTQPTSSHASHPSADPISAKVREETELAFLRITNPSAAQRLWENCLSPKDRQRLGNGLEYAWANHGKTVGMFMHARRVDQVEAIIQVAALLGFLRDHDRDRLLREWGLPVPNVAMDQRPIWNPETGKLYWGKEVIRTVRLLHKKPSNLQILLGEFEAEHWAEVIDSPFQFASQLHDALRILRRGLKRIHFAAVNAATQCRWEPISSARRKR